MGPSLEPIMETALPKVSDKLSKISDGRMHSPAVEMRGYVRAFLETRPERGRDRAVHEAAQAFGMTPRRVLAVLHDEVRRFWSDEMDRARSVYRDLLAAEERRATLRLAQLSAEQMRLDERDRQDGVA